MRRSLLVLATVLLALLPATALARSIGHDSASGHAATAAASGHIQKPRMVSVRVVSSPRQRATGNYTVVCSKGRKAGSKSGRLSGSGRFTRTLRMPTRHPDGCTVSARVSLARSGHITVTLLGH